jgi:beta-galactosidase GanA
MEKTEGVYDFEIFKYAMDVMYENGIYTILCTPTCTPPRWVFNKYDDLMRIRYNDYDNIKVDVHSRCHPCKSHKGIRVLNKKIASEMSKALGKHPGLIGWQIDNELYPYDFGCFCKRCTEEYRKYLKGKYGTIENLNKKWVMNRWSLDYSSFDEIMPPAPQSWEHPSHAVEWWRFQCQLINTYTWEQADAIREYSSAPIGTDMMMDNTLSYNIMNKKLDIVQHNHYDSQNELYRTFMNYDFYRTLKDKPFWVTETQPAYNGSYAAYNGYRPNGHNYINSLAPIVQGGEMNLYWLFRCHPAGHEMGHGAVYSSAGVPSPIAPSIKKLADTLDKTKDFLENSKVKSRIALTYSSTSIKNFMFAPIISQLDDHDHSYRPLFADRFYDAFRHYNVDLIETDKDLDEYEVIIAPLLSNFEDNGFDVRVKNWVENGGTLIVGPLSDIMTDYAKKHTEATYPTLEELAGVKVKHHLPLEQADFKAKWTQGGEIFDIFLGCDAFDCVDSESIAEYTGFDFEGMSAIAKRKVGNGTIILLGTAPDKKALLKLVDKAPILEASENVFLTKREGKCCGIIALEIEGKDGYITLDKEYYDILGKKNVSGKVEIKPYEAIFFEEIK